MENIDRINRIVREKKTFHHPRILFARGTPVEQKPKRFNGASRRHREIQLATDPHRRLTPVEYPQVGSVSQNFTGQART